MAKSKVRAKRRKVNKKRKVVANNRKKNSKSEMRTYYKYEEAGKGSYEKTDGQGNTLLFDKNHNFIKYV